MAMQITVRTQSADPPLQLSVNSDEDIQMIKERIQFAKGTPPEHQRLLFQGNHLDIGYTIGSYGIQNGSVIFLVVS